jgi:hypothetical protein
MKILNILVFSILLTTNVHAGGVYGNLYDNSDLVDPKSRFIDNPHQKLSDIKKEKEQRAKQEEEEQQTLNEIIDRKLNKINR